VMSLMSFINFTCRMTKSRIMKWAANIARDKKTNAYRILLGKLEGKRQLRRSKCRREYSIKIDLREIGWGGMDWIDPTHERDQWTALTNMVMNLRIP
jgi:hypothetical protein